MVSRDDLQEARDLQNESEQIQTMLDALKLPGAITAVTWTPVRPEESGASMTEGIPDPVTIPTIGLAYPPQMVTSIQEQLQHRYSELLKRLGELGVTVD